MAYTVPTGVTDTASASGVLDVDVGLFPSSDVVTTTTADPGTGGATLAVTERARFPQSAGFFIRVLGTSGIAEVMQVTGGVGTGAGSFNVTRQAITGGAGVAHSVGAAVQLMVGRQRVIPVDEKIIAYEGRASSFRTPGRAGTAGQKILAAHNATGSTILVDIQSIHVDLYQTVIKAVTVAPPHIRIHRFTAVPTNGTALAKVAVDTSQTSNSALTLWQDASADATSSGTTLTVTIPANSLITQEFAPRLITAAGYEMFDRTVFLDSDVSVITLRPLEGIVVFLDYTLATQNPVTDMWVAGLHWTEYRTG